MCSVLMMLKYDFLEMMGPARSCYIKTMVS
jgi:hypothetical protein